MVETVLAMTTLNPDEPEAIETYLSITGPLLEKVGAKVISQREILVTLAGEDAPQYVTLIEYPDRNAIEQVFESEAYEMLKPIRDKAFKQYKVCILS